ncbi:hypothetical protein ACFX15_018823 [Malus domestica]
MAGSTRSELRTPVFNGENYEFWRIRLRSILKSPGLWELVETGFTILGSSTECAVVVVANEKKEKGVATETPTNFGEIIMEDAKAIGLIQGAVIDQFFFPRFPTKKLRRELRISCSKSSEVTNMLEM